MFGWIKNLKKGLNKSSKKINEGLTNIFKSKKINEETLDELQDLLITSDIGISVSDSIIDSLRKKKLNDISLESVKKNINESLVEILLPVQKKLELKSTPHVILMIGVNGSGKTSSIGKLASKFSRTGKKVGIVAADTFRAAAIDQLRVWAERTKSKFYFTNVNSDSAALVYKSYNESLEDKIDVLLIDTAGRLHNKSNLMDELSKIIRVMKKIDEKLPQEIVLVLDGNSGQNSLKQVEKFNEVTSLSGTIITKLDGSAKGGFIVSISKKFKTPIFFIGVGESEDDLIDFNAKEFSKALLSL